ncbi:hypothetical protein GOODEAATRI_011879 [Goodea atripinnis]|uniref:Plectin/eS10 N-terminal domain-containing protein n=1 Tax=Goodea atripinnis TaxID=208336 RepID=A0ABV0N9W6_9TELE
MPMHELKAIYEVLFRDGVMVAKKDKRPQIKHPEVREVTNLQVIRAMGSLKSRGYVRETFAWRHFYWYLTNDGIVYLRDYLHLPTEIIPASLQRVRKPAATLAIAHCAARVQSVQGPTSYVPKPGRRDEAESQEALAERQGYRHKMMDPGERGNYTDRTPRFRGRPLTDEPVRPKPSLEVRDQHQPLYSRGATWNSKSVKEETHQRLNLRNEKQMVSQERRMLDVQKRNSTSVPLQTAGLKQDASQTTQISSVALPLPVAAAGVAAGKDSPVMASEMTGTEVPSKMTPERMCSEEVRQAAAVLSEAPTDKGEVELTQPFAEKNKREVPKAKTSSSARKAPAPEDLVSAEAQDSPLFRQEKPPRVAQHSAGQAAECSTQERLSASEAIEHEEDKKRDLVEDTPSATATPAAQPDQPHLGDISVSDIVDTDEATMRKKIVVVEEIVEVKQIVSPKAAGEQSPPPPVKTEVEEEELDLDVLEEIAIERALLIAAAEVKVQGASPEADWDQSLGEPQERIWPNVIEGLFECMETDLLPALS